MSHSIELPDDVYSALSRVAAASGTSPVEWVAQRVKQADPVPSTDTRSNAERFAGRVGQIASDGQQSLSTSCGEKFTDYLEEKRKAGRL